MAAFLGAVGKKAKWVVEESPDAFIALYYDGANTMEEILEKPCRLTYIFTDKSVEECAPFAQQKYYNLLCDVKLKDLTQEMIRGFVQTEYDTNEYMYLAKDIIKKFEDGRTAMESLSDLLMAIYTGDEEMFQVAAVSSLNRILTALDDIKEIFLLHEQIADKIRHAAQVEKKLIILHQEVERLQSRSADAELLRENEELRTALEGVNGKLAEALGEIDVLKRKLGDSAGLEAERAINAKLREDIRFLDKEKSALEVTLGAMRESVERTRQFGEEQVGVMDDLRGKLHKSATRPFVELVHELAPVLNDNIALDASAILQFKEIKHAVYMQSMLSVLDLTMEITVWRQFSQRPIVVVFDPMLNEFVVDKYRKHGFAVNQAPSGKHHTVVTNQLDLQFLRNTLQINTYRKIIFVDRYGTKKDLVENSLMYTYYLIDNDTDIVDYALDPNFCIQFGDTEGGAKYKVSPGMAKYKEKDRKSRLRKISDEGWLKEILTKHGVLQK